VPKRRKNRHCLRCGYRWLGRRSTRRPVKCASCDSIYWNKPKVKFTKSEIKKIERDERLSHLIRDDWKERTIVEDIF
jgi:hypothetical protein